MKKTITRQMKRLTVFAGLLFSAISGTSQIVHTESFDATTFLPTGWSTVGAAPDWTRRTTLSAPLVGVPHTGAGMARLSMPGGSTATSLTESICTPMFSLSGRGMNTPTVSLWIYRDSLANTRNDSIAILINNTVSLTGAVELGVIARCRTINVPDTMSMNGWYQYSFNVPSSFNTDTNYIILKGTIIGPVTGARRLFIDDINWDEYTAPCTGTPVAGTVTSPDTLICNGKGVAALTLSGSTIGAGITYSWYSSSSPNGPWTAFGTDTTSLFSDTLTSSTYIKCDVACTSSGLTDSSNKLLIVVNPNPTPVLTITAASDTICRGDTVLLVVTGASSYQWSTGGNPNLSTNDSISVFPINNTTYSVTGTDAYGCAAAMVSQTIVVGRRPTITSVTASSTTICKGSSTTLSATAFSGGGGVTLSYLWNPNSLNGASVTASPAGTTTFTLTVTGQYGCFSTDSVMVTVDTTLTGPVVSLAPDTVNICQGATAQIQFIASSPTANLTYAWAASSGGGISSSNDTVLVNPPIVSTTYTVTGTDPSTGCSTDAMSIVLVHRTPTLTLAANPTTLCKGGSTSMTATIGNTGGAALNTYTVQWAPAGLTGVNVVASPTVTTTYTTVVTSSFGCSATDSITITVDTTLVGPNVAVTPSSTSECSAALSPVQLVASSTSPGVSYSWTPAVLGTNDTVTVNPTNSAIYTAFGTDLAGCTSAASATVVVNSSPSAGFVYSVSGSTTVNFTSVSSGATSYAWSFGDGSTSTAQNPSYTYASSGTFNVTLTVTSAGGCIDSITQSVMNNPLGINKTVAEKYSVYPNPGNGIYSIQLNAEDTKALIQVYTIIGNEVMNKQISTTKEQQNKAEVDLTNLPDGIYIMNIKTGSGSVSVRLIKQ